MMAYITWGIILMMACNASANWMSCEKLYCPDIIKVTVEKP